MLTASNLFVAPRTVRPRYGSNLGGKPITLTGPCFSPFDDIVCNFGWISSPGRFISESTIQCLVPQNTQIKWRVSLSVSITGNDIEDGVTNATAGRNAIIMDFSQFTFCKSLCISTEEIYMHT